MGQAPQEQKDLRLRFGTIARNYPEAMDGLARIARQFTLTQRPDEILIDLFGLHNKLNRVSSEEPLETRLTKLTDDDVAFLSQHGSFRLLGPSLVLKPISEFRAGDIPESSPFHDMYCRYRDRGNRLSIWDLCPEDDETKPGMRLIAIKWKEEEYYEPERFRWRIGWVTEEEFQSFPQESNPKK